MTKKELMDSNPDLYNEILQDAKEAQKNEISASVEAERKRIMEIDEIANQVGDEELVREAKFGNTPMSASDLALVALKKQGEMGARFIKDMRSDADDSGVAGVKPMPNAGIKSKEEQELQDIMDGAALIAGVEGGKEQ